MFYASDIFLKARSWLYMIIIWKNYFEISLCKQTYEPTMKCPLNTATNQPTQTWIGITICHKYKTKTIDSTDSVYSPSNLISRGKMHYKFVVETYRDQTFFPTSEIWLSYPPQLSMYSFQVCFYISKLIFQHQYVPSI